MSIKKIMGHMKVWGADAELSEDTMENVAYGVRAFLSQLLNHKAKTRTIPKAFESKFACIWSLLPAPAPKTSKLQLASKDQQPASDDESSDVEIIAVKPHENEIVDLDFDLEELKQQTFSSDDPEIQRLMADGETPRRRRTGKQTPENGIARKAVPKNTQRLAAPSSLSSSCASPSPKAFAELNQTLKAMKSMKHMKSHKSMKNMKSMKSMKTTKSMKQVKQFEPGTPEAWAAFVKREHWKAWMMALQKAKAEGKDAQACKEAASTAGRARTATLRQQRKAADPWQDDASPDVD